MLRSTVTHIFIMIFCKSALLCTMSLMMGLYLYGIYLRLKSSLSLDRERIVLWSI